MLGCSPALDSSHHQDYYIFGRDPNLNLPLPLASWEEGQPNLYDVVHKYNYCTYGYTWYQYVFLQNIFVAYTPLHKHDPKQT